MDKIIFKRKLRDVGANVLGLSIPPQLIRFLDAELGDTVELYGDSGKHGKFVSFWIPSKQKKNEE